MRYQTLEIYSGVLRAAGYLLMLGSVITAIVLGAMAYQMHDRQPSANTVAVAAFILMVGLVNGLITAATGQFLCVVIDIEANTRVAARQERHLDR